MDIQFNEENTNLKRLLQTSKTHFIIKRERVTNYKTADYEGDFVVVIYDKSFNGTFINSRKLIDKKGILHNNDTISIAKPDNEVFQYVQTTNSVYIPPELARYYVALRTLGHGSCGPVELIYSKTGYCPLVLKCIKKNSLDETAHQDNFMNEANILKGLKHPNIIKMVHAINTPSDIFIILELMQGGNLFDRIKNNGLSEELTKFYFYQIATAVEYLHDKKITHRNLKPENILLRDNDEYTLVKVTDIGLMNLVNDGMMVEEFRFAPYYAAPEIFKRQQYTSQGDVWSLGVILYVMLSGCLPFLPSTTKSISDVVIEGSYNYTPDKFRNVSDEAKYLIGSMLKVDPNDRYTASKIVAHSWLNDRELMERISIILEPYININNNDNSDNKSANVDREIGSLQRDDEFLNDIPMKRLRLE
ncbi:ovarian-specific serine/threonine-protein kinase Lok-like [Aphidius gifuensis]|nr:ovarian-specific serine/threonine-protein kinase Lok-like [Aphidius gifuensis]